MSWKRTFILLGITLGLFAYVMVYEVEHGADGGTTASFSLLPGFDREQVMAIGLETGGESIRVERNEAGKWDLTAPDSYPAEEQVLKILFDACEKVQSHKLVSAKEVETQPGGLADYGLETPRFRLTIEQKDESLVVEVGADTPAGNFTYVRLGDEEQLHLATSRFASMIPPQADLIRSRSLLLLGEDSFDQLEIKTASGGFTAVRDDNGAWQITQPPPVKRADSYKLNLLAEKLREWEVRAFARIDSEEALEKIGLKTPAAVLTVSRDDEPLARIEFGAAPDGQEGMVFARLGFKGNVVMTTGQLLETLKLPFSEFRDRRLLNIDPAAVQRVEVENAEEAFALQRWPYDQWKFVNPTNLLADDQFVSQMVTNLTALEIMRNGWESDVVSDYQPFGLAEPVQTVRLFATTNLPSGDLTNIPLATLSVGTNTLSGKTFVRTDEAPSVYGIATGVYEEIATDRFELRERRIWDFFLTNVVSVIIAKDGKSVEYRPNKDGQWNVGSSMLGGFVTTLFSVCQLKAERWLTIEQEEMARLGITPEAHTVEIQFQKNGNMFNRKLIIGKKAPRGNGYAATVVDGTAVAFEMDGNLYGLIQDYMPPPK